MKLRLLGAVICLLALKVNAAVIDFEEFQSSAPILVQEIGGLEFLQTYTQDHGIYVRDSSDLYGQFNLASSGVMGAYISHGQLIRAVDGSPFDFLSFYSGKTHCCSVYDTFLMEGIRNGQAVYSSTNIYREQQPRLNLFNWESIDEVRISLYDLSGGYFIMDDLEYSISTVPIPPSLYLFGTGLIGLVGRSLKRVKL